MKAKYIIGTVIIVAFAVWGISSFMATTVRYVSLSDVPRTNGTVQVMGKIDFNAVQYDTERACLVFDITDLQDQASGRRLKIIYTGIVPGNFDQATSVVARGRYQDGAFLADQLLVKCPSKYQGMDKGA